MSQVGKEQPQGRCLLPSRRHRRRRHCHCHQRRRRFNFESESESESKSESESSHKRHPLDHPPHTTAHRSSDTMSQVGKEQPQGRRTSAIL